jgi:PAS domain S-box-containing protein
MSADKTLFIGSGEEALWQYDFVMSDAFLGFLDLIPEAAVLSNEQGKVLVMNQTALHLFEYSQQTLADCVIEDLVPSQVRAAHVKLRALFFEDPRPRYLGSRNLDLYACKRGGEQFPMESALFAIKTEKGAIAINLIRDISNEKAAQQKISKYAFVDALTNLPSWRYFDEMLKRCVAEAERHEHKLAVLYIDLDKFKPINDQFGHEKGDFVLREIAK